MKKIILTILLTLAGIYYYKFYLNNNSIENNKPSLEREEYQEAIDQEKKIREQILKSLPFKKSGNHFSAHDLKELDKYKERTGFLVGPLIIELEANNNFNLIKLTVKNMKEKMVTPKALSNLHLKINDDLVPLFASRNGIYYTKVLPNKEILKEKVNLIIWGKYKENSFSGKTSINFSSKREKR